MAGIYIHIPFCKQACHYCDFHFSTSVKLYDGVINAIQKEIVMRKSELEESVETIYFGGGTPSLLKAEDLSQLIETVKASYTCLPDLELTLECNPDDVSETKLEEWRQSGVNRLSLGIQSFDDDVLKWMNRAHDASMSQQAFKMAREAGFSNISCDLIYGIPEKNKTYWEQQLAQMMTLRPEHLSCYCLTVEPKTVLDHQLKKGHFTLPSQEQSGDQFLTMRDALKEQGYDQYEVSNFCLPGKASKHNSSYWKNALYLGFGPSAHSFNGRERRWNIANNARYIEALEKDEQAYESEILTPQEQYNEYVMTGLRTMWGVDEVKIGAFGAACLENFKREARIYDSYFIKEQETVWRLNEAGLLIADKIASDLFIVD